MSWNPSPEVAAARDFGEKFGDDQVVIIRVNNATGRIGFASWGKTKALCDGARLLGDIAYDAIYAEVERQG